MVGAEPSPNEKRKAKRRRTRNRSGGKTVCNCSDTGGELPINGVREKKMRKESQTSNWARPDWHLSSLLDSHNFDHRTPSFVSLASCFSLTLHHSLVMMLMMISIRHGVGFAAYMRPYIYLYGRVRLVLHRLVVQAFATHWCLSAIAEPWNCFKSPVFCIKYAAFIAYERWVNIFLQSIIPSQSSDRVIEQSWVGSPVPSHYPLPLPYHAGRKKYIVLVATAPPPI